MEVRPESFLAIRNQRPLHVACLALSHVSNSLGPLNILTASSAASGVLAFMASLSHDQPDQHGGSCWNPEDQRRDRRLLGDRIPGARNADPEVEESRGEPNGKEDERRSRQALLSTAEPPARQQADRKSCASAEDDLDCVHVHLSPAKAPPTHEVIA